MCETRCFKRQELPHPTRLLMFAALLATLTMPATPARAQRTDDPDSARATKDYTIGSGDVLAVTVADAPEFGGKFRVGDSGSIQLPGVPQPIVAEGKTPTELSEVIQQALIDAKQMRAPHVNVFVEEFHGSTVAVLGAVNKPAVYSLQRHTTVLEAISEAGGALPNSGNTVTIVRGRASAEATNTSVGSVQIIDLGRLTKGENPAADVEVRKGDVVNVSAVQVVYVVGAVIKPGGFTMNNPAEGISALQAVALAEGLTSLASSHHAVIVRQSTSEQGRTEIPVDLGRIMSGQQTDAVLAPNDILYVPKSGAKQTLKVLGDVAMATVNGIAIYGIGYKIGTSY